MKIALFLPNWIGDVVMATPALRAVRRHYPQAELVVVARPYVADVLAGLDLYNRVMFYEPRGDQRDRRGWRFVRQLRREQFDSVLLLPNSLRSGWLSWLSGASRRVGFDRDGRGLLLTDAVKPKPKSPAHPVLDEYNRLALKFGCATVSRQTELALLAEDEQTFRQVVARRFPRIEQKGYFCLNPGGAFGAAKHWPTRSFSILADLIASRLDKNVLVLCGPAERDIAREIAQQSQNASVYSLADVAPSIGLTKAAIRHADLLVTTDSGPRHFAQPFRVPVVTLFGPTHIAWSETYYDNGIHLQHQVDCGPCQQRVCPLGHHQCMRDLTVERVFAATQQLWNRNAVRKVAA